MAGEALIGVVSEAWPSDAACSSSATRSSPSRRGCGNQPAGLVESSGGRLELKFITRDQMVRPATRWSQRARRQAAPGCLLGTVAAGVAAAEDQPFYKDLPGGSPAASSPRWYGSSPARRRRTPRRRRPPRPAARQERAGKGKREEEWLSGDELPFLVLVTAFAALAVAELAFAPALAFGGAGPDFLLPLAVYVPWPAPGR